MHLAEITDPATTKAPGRPRNLSVTLNASGSLTLAWQATDSDPDSGVYFTVRRVLPARTAATFLGGTGGKQFTDDTIPPGTTFATYTIQGSRNGILGAMSEPFTVRFTTLPCPDAAGLLAA